MPDSEIRLALVYIILVKRLQVVRRQSEEKTRYCQLNKYDLLLLHFVEIVVTTAMKYCIANALQMSI